MVRMSVTYCASTYTSLQLLDPVPLQLTSNVLTGKDAPPKITCRSLHVPLFSPVHDTVTSVAPFMSTVKDGTIKVYRTQGGQPEEIRVQGGFAEVNAKGLTVLAEHVEG